MPRRKRPETPPPENLTNDQQMEVLRRIKNHKDSRVRAYQDRKRLRLEWDRCSNHFYEKHLKTGEGKCDWARTFYNWIVNEVVFEDKRKKDKQREKPQYDLDKRTAGGNVVPIREVLEEISDDRK